MFWWNGHKSPRSHSLTVVSVVNIEPLKQLGVAWRTAAGRGFGKSWSVGHQPGRDLWAAVGGAIIFHCSIMVPIGLNDPICWSDLNPQADPIKKNKHVSVNLRRYHHLHHLISSVSVATSIQKYKKCRHFTARCEMICLYHLISLFRTCFNFCTWRTGARWPTKSPGVACLARALGSPPRQCRGESEASACHSRMLGNPFEYGADIFWCSESILLNPIDNSSIFDFGKQISFCCCCHCSFEETKSLLNSLSSTSCAFVIFKSQEAQQRAIKAVSWREFVTDLEDSQVATTITTTQFADYQVTCVGWMF